MKANLLSAIRKCTHNHGSEWYGYLRPQEILELRDLGVKCKEYDIEIAIHWKRSGICNGRWFYFEANDKFTKLKGGFNDR